MNRVAKICIILSGALVILSGSVLGMSACASGGKIGPATYESNTYTVSEKINNIVLNTDTADIEFVLSVDESCKVVCYENKNRKHSVEINNGTLNISEYEEKKWYEYINFSFNSPKITVFLPAQKYEVLNISEDTGDISISQDLNFKNIDIITDTGDIICYASASERIKIETDTGNIKLKNIDTGSLDLTVSTGCIEVFDSKCKEDITIYVSTGETLLKNVTCKNLTTDGSTGDISLNSVIASEGWDIKRSTGEVKFDRCDASTILIETSTGEVEGTILSEKIFIAKSSTGDIDVPETTSGGICKITTSTGDIDVIIVN